FFHSLTFPTTTMIYPLSLHDALPICRLLLILGFAGGGIALGFRHRLNLELFDRAGHFADLVLASQPRQHDIEIAGGELAHRLAQDRKSTRLNSSHQIISYAVFCLKNK